MFGLFGGKKNKPPRKADPRKTPPRPPVEEVSVEKALSPDEILTKMGGPEEAAKIIRALMSRDG